ncbi:hypothetical protein NUSPORA_01542 [Nucleospora cyclopteri]
MFISCILIVMGTYTDNKTEDDSQFDCNNKNILVTYHSYPKNKSKENQYILIKKWLHPKYIESFLFDPIDTIPPSNFYFLQNENVLIKFDISIKSPPIIRENHLMGYLSLYDNKDLNIKEISDNYVVIGLLGQSKKNKNTTIINLKYTLLFNDLDKNLSSLDEVPFIMELKKTDWDHFLIVISSAWALNESERFSDIFYYDRKNRELLLTEFGPENLRIE